MKSNTDSLPATRDKNPVLELKNIAQSPWQRRLGIDPRPYKKPPNLVVFCMVGATGLEPAASWSQTRRSSQLSYTPKICLTPRYAN